MVAWRTCLIVGAGLAAWATWRGPDLIARWQADRTARNLIHALYHVDSARLAQLSARGSARNLLCARRLWPWHFWMQADGSPLGLEVVQAASGSYGYRTVGGILPGTSERAVFESIIRRQNPTKVVRYFADSRTGVWNDTVRACMSL